MLEKNGDGEGLQVKVDTVAVLPEDDTPPEVLTPPEEETAPLAPEEAQRQGHIDLQANKALARGFFATVGGLGEMVAERRTRGIISKEANFNDAELDVLVEAWAPLLPNLPPLYTALLVTAMVVSGKWTACYLIYHQERGKDEKPPGESPESNLDEDGDGKVRPTA